MHTIGLCENPSELTIETHLSAPEVLSFISSVEACWFVFESSSHLKGIVFIIAL
jgi:hypothetical protein